MKAPPNWLRRFEISVSILTALVTILSAVVAWRAALAGDAAGNADFAGIGATLNREESRTLNSATAYQQYRAYTTYLRNNETGQAMADDLDDSTKTISDEQRAIIANERTASWDQIVVDQDFFQTRHLRADGTYNVLRQIGESEAEDAQRKDIDPDPHFAESDRLRIKSNLMVGMLILMAGSLWFYTMASEIKHVIRYPLAGIGLLCMLIGTIGTFAIEVL
jgi:hypothetical protein